jgi:predicted permease
VLSYRFWKRRFGLDPAVLGRTVYVDQTAVTVAGVTPREFFGVDAYGDVYPDLWLPIPSGERFSMVWIFGRLKPGVPLSRARAELGPATAEFQDLRRDRMKLWPASERAAFLAEKFDLRPLSKGIESLRMRFSEPLRILAALSGLLLLIACANVANLLLARSAARSREIALRRAVGAGRGRLLRQLLTESVLLASLSGSLGLGFAFWAHRLLLAFLLSDPAAAVPLDLAFNYRLLAFAAAMSFATGVLFGIAPALSATSPRLHRRRGMMKPLMTLQVAASLLLVVTAGLFVRSLENLQARDPGFERERLLLMTIEAPKSHPIPQRDLIDRIAAVPGVSSAALAANTVFGGGWVKTVRVDGYNDQPSENLNAAFNIVGPNFFATSRIPLLIGREFTPSDRDGAPLVAMVNEAFAKKYFPNGNPLAGRYGGPASGRKYEIIGVVADSRAGSLRASEIPTVYEPLLQPGGWQPQALNLHVRTAANPAALAESIRREALAVDEDLTVYNVRTIAQELGDSLRRDRMFAALSSFFGLTALLLASVGLYGMLAYAVARRTKEISIRMALGAPRRRILWMVLRQTLLVVAAGSAIGVPAALSATGALKSVLFGLSPTDPATFAAAVAMLAAVAAIAGYLPARRATKVDPMEALRYE